MFFRKREKTERCYWCEKPVKDKVLSVTCDNEKVVCCSHSCAEEVKENAIKLLESRITWISAYNVYNDSYE